MTYGTTVARAPVENEKCLTVDAHKPHFDGRYILCRVSAMNELACAIRLTDDPVVQPFDDLRHLLSEESPIYMDGIASQYADAVSRYPPLNVVENLLLNVFLGVWGGYAGLRQAALEPKTYILYEPRRIDAVDEPHRGCSGTIHPFFATDEIGTREPSVVSRTCPAPPCQS